ncbi:hypothetical protein LCGC14_1642470 [marine sediment metagenome]|uniref:Uncharacterized protein n=1 Tax=marine sediment metagenome TaxID=412755 RepID=A0A0F9KF16_9ZZZZ
MTIDTVRYEAIGCGVYEVNPTAKPDDPEERMPVACTGDDVLDGMGRIPSDALIAAQSALATRIAAALNSSEALVAAASELADWAEDTESHGEGAFDDNCPVCIAIQTVRTILASATPTAEEVGG